MFKDAKVGDRVWSMVDGWGVIITYNTLKFPGYHIEVKFDVSSEAFTYGGKALISNINPTLFWDEIKFEIPKKPLPKLDVDTRVRVWDGDNKDNSARRYFSHFSKDGFIQVFQAGMTSWTNHSSQVPYSNWELADEN